MPSNRSHHSPQTATAETKNGRAMFLRSGPGSAFLEVEYSTPDVQIDLRQRPFPEAINAMCESEVARMRDVLSRLGDALASHLSDEGNTPVVKRNWKNNESRPWSRNGTTFTVQGMRARLADNLKGYEGASDAKLVQEHIRQMMEQREANIRDIYARVLADCQGRTGQPFVGGEKDGIQD